MTAEVDIANLALGRIKQGTIPDFDDDSAEADACKRLYPIVRNRVLGSFPWRVNTYIQSLAVLTNDREDDWGYRYQRPTCIKFHGVLDQYGRLGPNVRERIRYEMTASGIYCDIPNARGAIGTLVTDTALYSPALVSCMAWDLAGELVPVLDGDLNLVAWTRRMFESEQQEAWGTDAAECLVMDDPSVDALPGLIACRE